MIRSGDPAAVAMIRQGHRGLLTTFREFARGLDATGDRLPEPEELRALIAFLRQSLLPFAHWEERHLDGCAEIVEDTAFEHAFLNAEVDALAAAVAGLERGVAGTPAGITPRVRRHLHRIEALLELHVQKAEDRESQFTPVDTHPGGRAEAGTCPVRVMDPVEIHRFLLRHQWGILCTVGQGAPYGVPVSYGFDGRSLFVASGPGRKRRNLETDASVCITVAEVEDGDHWTSVVVTGNALHVDDLRGKFHALNSIRRQRSNGGAPSATDLARIAGASIFRITADQITGRVRG